MRTPYLKTYIINASLRLSASTATCLLTQEARSATTPSAAAVFVLGGSQNGWTEWVSDDGETLNQVYRSEEN